MAKLLTDTIVVYDNNFKIIFINEAGLELFNVLSAGEVIGKSITDFISTKYRGTILKHSCFMELEEEKNAELIEEKLVFTDGRIIDIEATITSIGSRDTPIYMAVIRNISSGKRTKKELIEARRIAEWSQRLALFETMAAGFAHQINQPLNSLKIITSGILYRYDKGKRLEVDEIVCKVKEISKLADQIDKIIKRMRSSVRSEHSFEVIPCCLNKIVENVLNILEMQLFSCGIEAKKVLFSPLPPVRGNPGRLEELIINLLVNAIQSLNSLSKKNKKIIIKTLKEEKVVLEISDNATGISDEITELPLNLQSKLLRVIQEKEFYRVGGLKKIKSDVRILCATNEDIEKKVKQGSFRKDLYFRLNVGRIIIPPLRERTGEIIPLTKMFMEEFSRQRRDKFSIISNSAANLLSSYDWPGNVRELKNLMELITSMFEDIELRPEHLAIMPQFNIKKVYTESNAQPINDLQNFSMPIDKFDLEEHFSQIIARSLEIHNGNKSQTARYLGISRKTLYRHMRCCK